MSAREDKRHYAQMTGHKTGGTHPIAGVSTSITAFIGRAVRGPVNEPVALSSFSEFERIFGGLWRDSTLGYAVRDFFDNGGTHAVVVRLYRRELPLPMHEDFLPPHAKREQTGLYALEKLDIFNVLCIPPYTPPPPGLDVEPELVEKAASYCEKRRAMLVVDSPSSWTTAGAAKDGLATLGCTSKNAALYFPRLVEPDPLRAELLRDFAACGAVAGVFARIDAQLGVWKAPAGTKATLSGISGFTVPLTDTESRELNAVGINCLRNVPAAGNVIWGARTLQGDDRFGSEWKYIAVRRLALYLEESISRGIQWVVFETNDERLWAEIRLNVSEFMHGLFTQGAFAGTKPEEAYFVKCDEQTNAPSDVERGVVRILVGFAPLKPAEFLLIHVQQKIG